MKRNPLRLNGATETDTDTAAADGTVTESLDEEAARRVARRRALLKGGAVVAGAVGAGAALAATATPAKATTDSAILQSEPNTATTDANPTEIVATSTSNANPTLVLTNNGSPESSDASPQLRVTPAATGLVGPAKATVGGDVTATNDGNLWFTHAVPNPGHTPNPIIIPATVHTDATSNSFVPLTAPFRILDTRPNTAIRQYILDASGNTNSEGMLLGGHTIHIDLSSLVIYGDAVTANLTVETPTATGWVLIWPGGSMPNASSIGFAADQAIANLTVCGINHTYSSSVTDSVAIHAAVTTHVLLDVAGFYVANTAQVTQKYNGLGGSASMSAARASQIRAATGQ